MSYADAMQQDYIGKDDTHWEYLRCIANILMEDCIKENVKVVQEFVDDEVTKVEIDNKEFLGPFVNLFIQRGHIVLHGEDIFPLEGQTMVTWDFTS